MMQESAPGEMRNTCVLPVNSWTTAQHGHYRSSHPLSHLTQPVISTRGQSPRILTLKDDQKSFKNDKYSILLTI